MTSPDKQKPERDATDVCADFFGAEVADKATALLGVDELEELMRLGVEFSLVSNEVQPYYDAIYSSQVITTNHTSILNH